MPEVAKVDTFNPRLYEDAISKLILNDFPFI